MNNVNAKQYLAKKQRNPFLKDFANSAQTSFDTSPVA